MPVQNDSEDCIRHELKSPTLILCSVLQTSSRTRLWSNVKKKMLKSIFNFPFKYLNNTLASLQIVSFLDICVFFSASSLKLSNTLHLVASPTWTTVGIPDVISRFFGSN